MRGVMASAAVLLLATSACGEADPSTRPDLAGELFGKPVPRSVFAYHYKTAALFTRSGETERTQEQTEQEAWQNMMLLNQAGVEGITVGKTELRNELKRLVDARGVDYGGATYEQWVRKNLGEDVQTFERRIEDLMKINRLMERHTNPTVTATKEEVKQKFLNQRNQLEQEYIGFDTAAEADAFLEQVRAQPSLWKPTFDDRRKAKGQQGGAWINLMTIEALVDLWKFPQDELYRMIAEPEGTFTRSRHLYGEVVARLLDHTTADLAEFTEAKREALRNDILLTKKYHAVKGFFDDLTKRAALRNYIQERRDAQEQARRKALVPELERKSTVVLETSQGPITLRLWPQIAPHTCENFIGLVEKGYYNGLIFHRVIKEFMIQSGDPAGNGTGGESLWGIPFEDEVKPDVMFDRPGLLAMANSGPNTNSSQFFITTVPTPWLNGKHTIFGEVIAGMEAVKRIESTPVGASDKPKEPQTMTKVVIQAAEGAP